MKTAHEPPMRAGQDDVLHALASIIATTREQWGLPPPRRKDFGVPESFSSQPYQRTAMPRRPRLSE